MSRPTRSRQDLRLDVLKQLDPVSEPKSSSTTSDSDSLTLLIDSLLAPAAESEDFVGDWIYVRSQPTATTSGSTVDGAHNTVVTTLAVTSGTDFTVGDGIQVTVSTVTETMRVTVIATNNLTVVRAIQGSTAVTMSGSEVVKIVGPAIGEIARVTAVDFSSSNSKLTVAPGFSASLVSGQEYERHRKVRPNIINDKLDVTLGLIRQNVLLPITLVVGGDMEGTLTSDFTGQDAVITANTTASRILHGRQSVIVTTTSAAGFGSPGQINFSPGTRVIVAADVWLPGVATTGCRLTLYDVTNSEEIDSATAMATGVFSHLEFLATVPSNSHLTVIRLIGLGSGESAYWDNVTVWPVEDQGIPLPSFLEFVYDMKELIYFPLGASVTGTPTGNDNAYVLNQQTPQFFAHYQQERDDTGVHSARLYVKGRQPPHPLWLTGRKAYPAFSGDTDADKDTATTAAHKNVVVNMTTASILDDLALTAIEAEKDVLATSLQNKALLLRFEINGLLASMTPPKKKIVTTPFTRE